jgi:hypothetical protein
MPLINKNGKLGYFCLTLLWQEYLVDYMDNAVVRGYVCFDYVGVVDLDGLVKMPFGSVDLDFLSLHSLGGF